MSTPDFIRFYFVNRLLKKEIEYLFSLFQSENINILHPKENKISLLDWEGEQFFMSEIEFLNHFVKQDKTTFQVWINNKTDIVCSFKYDAQKKFYRRLLFGWINK